jgi:transcriptional regulator with XRE-family HTH domain
MADDLGRRLRALRAASGRTVAAVAADAGLSVPYVANLENGRGNPTVAALTRLAQALGTRLTVGFGDTGDPPSPLPAALVRLGRTPSFRREVRAWAEVTDQDADELAGRLLDVLSRLSALTGRELTERDRLRLLDALLLIALHPDPGEAQ